MLTVEELKSMKDEEIFRSGTFSQPYWPQRLPWIAIRGCGHPDWAIYFGRPNDSFGDIAAHGDKVKSAEIIRDLVPCDDKAFALYRY